VHTYNTTTQTKNNNTNKKQQHKQKTTAKQTKPEKTKTAETRKMGRAGFEPTIFAAWGQRPSQLDYRPKHTPESKILITPS
jgi:hypothetical protein